MFGSFIFGTLSINAPNDHNVTYFNNLRNIVINTKEKHKAEIKLSFTVLCKAQVDSNTANTQYIYI